MFKAKPVFYEGCFRCYGTGILCSSQISEEKSVAVLWVMSKCTYDE